MEHFIIGPDGDVLFLPHPHPSAPAPTPGQPSSPHLATRPPEALRLEDRQRAEAQAGHLEQQARAKHGQHSFEAARWARVRHQLRTASRPWAASTDLWIAWLCDGLTRLPPDSPELHAAAATAYDCWRQITDPAEAADIGPRLLDVLKRLDRSDLLPTAEHWTAEAQAVVASWPPPTAAPRPPAPNQGQA